MVIPETEISPMEKSLKNPGLVHLAENIVNCEDLPTNFESRTNVHHGLLTILFGSKFWIY